MNELQPLGDNPLTCPYTTVYQPGVPYRSHGLEVALFYTIISSDHPCSRDPPTVPDDGLLRNQNGIFAHPLLHLGMHKHSWQQSTFRVGENSAQCHRAGALVNTHFGEFQGAGKRVGTAVIQGQANFSLVSAGAFQITRLQCTLERKDAGDGLSDIDIDRIELVHRCHGVVLTIGHKRTFGNSRTAYTACDRREHFGVLDIDIGHALIRFGLLPRCNGIIMLLLAHSTGFE
ncbi:hypothetical protein D3C80_1006800 [compost metagenome]